EYIQYSPLYEKQILQYSAYVPFALYHVQWGVVYGNNNTITIDNAPIPAPLDPGNATLFAVPSGGYSQLFPLPLVNVPYPMHIISAWDGLYSLSVTRLPPNMLGLNVSVQSS